MSKLSTLLIVALAAPCTLTAQVSLDQLPDLPALDIPSFDPAQHLCYSSQRAVETYKDSYLWLDYMRALNVGEANVDPQECSGNTLRRLTRSVFSKEIDDVTALDGIIAFWGTFFERGVYAASPEARYANDIEALGFLTLACRRFAKSEMLECIRGVVQFDYNGYVESSPVFCDFAMQDSYSADLQANYAPAREIIAEIPGTCTGVLDDPETPTEQQQQIWWETLSGFLMINPGWGK